MLKELTKGLKLTATYLIDKIMNYYRVYTLTELSKKLDIGQPAITKWRKNNSINAIKKRCRELGIYDEIFGDLEKIKSIDDLIENRNKTLKNIDLFKNLDYFNYSEQLIILKQNCKNYDIQTTTVNNERILYFFETLFENCELNNKLKELEEDIKNLILKYNPNVSINKTTADLFFEFLEKNIEEQKIKNS